MKILVLHNKYKIRGGEDSVFEMEVELLKHSYHQVETVVFSNDSIVGLQGKLRALVGITNNSASLTRLESKIAKFEPDIIHVHNFFPLLSPGVFSLANKLNIPIVFTVHNYRLLCPGALLMRDGSPCEACLKKEFAWKAVVHGCYRDSYLETFALSYMNYSHNLQGTWQNNVSRYIVLSDFAKSKFLESSLGIPEHKLVVKSNFVEDRGYSHERSDRFLFVGRLSEEKGIQVLLDAFVGSEYSLDIIGGGPLENKVQALASEHGNIDYLGFQGSSFVLDAMKQCKALVFPSIWYEGMPMTILEAFSTGCPVIASNIGVMASLIEHRNTGLLFEPSDSKALRLQLSCVTEQMSFSARDEYLNKYTSEANYVQLMNVYNEAINE